MNNQPKHRYRIRVKGIVQGVGFRPFVYRLASQFQLSGFVLNDVQGVFIEIEGTKSLLDEFFKELKKSPPQAAKLDEIVCEEMPPLGEQSFIIKKSRGEAQKQTLISPDLAICRDCLRELNDPLDYRYRYPFINCTNCGPRFTIIKELPYDRKLTTMSIFPLCEVCEKQYRDPLDRRFHAQPVACSRCGPRLIILNSNGEEISTPDPMAYLAKTLLAGKITALKGLGGFHIACDATSRQAVEILRERKNRGDKPFALMVKDLEAARELCLVTQKEAVTLGGIEAPIVLIKQKPENSVADNVAPGQENLGLMLPYTPLHSLLLNKVNRPLVMTSGNAADEPIVYSNQEAIEKLSGLVDLFLIHDREIFSRCDDSVVRIFNQKLFFLRRSRGYAPKPIKLPLKLKKNILGTGAELKNAFCLGKGREAFISQHIGDLKNPESLEAFKSALATFERLFSVTPEIIAHDLHPQYLSTTLATEEFPALKKIAVQHHHAHIASVMAENGLTEKIIGVAFDGTGYGTDGKIWGGEWLIANFKEYTRAFHLKYFPLPGGDKAIEEPWRVALALLYPLSRENLLDLPLGVTGFLTRDNWELFFHMLNTGKNAPLTSSMGRLFDAVSALLGVRFISTYEAQAAIELEALALQVPGCYSFNFQEKIIDFRPMLEEILWEILQKHPIAEISYKFHATIAQMVRTGCDKIRESTGISEVALSGGVFQNTLLLKLTLRALKNDGFKVYFHNQLPTNDGGLALGQIMVADQQI